MRSRIAKLSKLFRANVDGSIAPTFAVLVVPMVGLIGAALDYSRGANQQTGLQSALDAAVLAAANDGTSNWESIAQNVFQANYAGKGAANAQFAMSGSSYTGSATGAVATTLLTPLGYKSIAIGAKTSALVKEPESETSCFLSLGKAMTIDDLSMTFSGSPNVLLSGCALRSNTSMKCNGHNTGALVSAAAGTSTNCSNPISGARAISDIYAPLASNITRKCTSTSSNITWRPGDPPNSSRMVTVQLADRIEYHVCGSLTLSGTGSLTGSSPALDTIIVIENGSLTLASNANISATRTAIVLTGNNSVSSTIDFPNGNGHSASLTLSPPTASTNPWAGISLYQDPSLTFRVDSSWGPGATFAADGVVYMPNASLSLGGNASSASTGCTKIVANQITMGGAIDVRQTPTGCDTLKVKQWSVPRSVVISG